MSGGCQAARLAAEVAWAAGVSVAPEPPCDRPAVWRLHARVSDGIGKPVEVIGVVCDHHQQLAELSHHYAGSYYVGSFLAANQPTA